MTSRCTEAFARAANCAIDMTTLAAIVDGTGKIGQVEGLAFVIARLSARMGSIAGDDYTLRFLKGFVAEIEAVVKPN